MARVLDQIGAQAGVRLKPLRGAERDVVMVRFRGTPLAQVMADLAAAVEGRWLQQGEVSYLEAELPPNVNGLSLEDCRRLWSTLEMADPLTEAQMLDLINRLRNRLTPQTAAHQAFVAEVRAAARSLPYERVLIQIAGMLGPQAAVGMEPGDSRGFSARPTPIQSPLPPAAIPLIARAEVEADAFRRRLFEAGIISSDDRGSLYPIESDYKQVKEIRSPVVRLTALRDGGLQITLEGKKPEGTIGPANKQPVWIAAVTVPSGAGIPSAEKTPALAEPPQEHTLEIEQLRQMIQDHLRSPREPVKPPEIWTDRLRAMAQDEPLAGPASGYARSLAPRDGDAIVLLPDAALEPQRMESMFAGGQVNWPFGLAPLRSPCREGLAVVRPANLAAARSSRLPRAEAAALLARLELSNAPATEDAISAVAWLGQDQLTSFEAACFPWLHSMKDLLDLLRFNRPLLHIAGTLKELERSAAKQGGLQMSVDELLRRWPEEGRRFIVGAPLIRTGTPPGPASEGEVSNRSINAETALVGAWPPQGEVLILHHSVQILAMKDLTLPSRFPPQQMTVESAAGTQKVAESGKVQMRPVWAVTRFGALSMRVDYGNGLIQSGGVFERWQTRKLEFGPFESLPKELVKQIQEAMEKLPGTTR